jgi:hypothetical protein
MEAIEFYAAGSDKLQLDLPITEQGRASLVRHLTPSLNVTTGVSLTTSGVFLSHTNENCLISLGVIIYVGYFLCTLDSHIVSTGATQ